MSDDIASGLKLTEERYIHSGKFHFSRAYWTTMGILLSWTTWLLIPLLVGTILFVVFGGLGAVLPGDTASEPTSSYSCDSDMEIC